MRKTAGQGARFHRHERHPAVLDDSSGNESLCSTAVQISQPAGSHRRAFSQAFIESHAGIHLPALGATGPDTPDGVFSKLFSDGLLALFLAAAALPALPFPVVIDGPAAGPLAAVPAVLPPAADPPAAEPPPAEPLPLCAKAIVVERVIAANTAHIRFMMSALLMVSTTNNRIGICSNADASIRACAAPARRSPQKRKDEKPVSGHELIARALWRQCIWLVSFMHMISDTSSRSRKPCNLSATRHEVVNRYLCVRAGHGFAIMHALIALVMIGVVQGRYWRENK
jgi:hypothetical protein